MLYMSYIKNKSKVLQACDFKNMRFHRNCMPTDIDGFLELNNNAFIWFEVKEFHAPEQRAQRIALMRLVDMAEKAGKKGALIYSYHQDEELIDLGETYVYKAYMTGKWWTTSSTIKTQDFTRELIAQWTSEGIKL